MLIFMMSLRTLEFTPIVVDAEDTVYQILVLAEELTWQHIGGIRLYHADQLLRGPNTLQSHGVQDQSVILVAKVHVVTARCLDTWKDYSLDVFTWTTAGALSLLISDYIGVPGHAIVVLYGRDRLAPLDHLPLTTGTDDTVLHFYAETSVAVPIGSGPMVV